MFDLSAWLTESLISGVQCGLFAREYVAVKVADYMIKGVLSTEQVEQISIDAVYAPPEVPAPVEIPVIKEPMIDPITDLPIAEEPAEVPV